MEEKKIYSVAIIGAGARGADTYGRLFMQFPELFKIVALCDKSPARLERFGTEFNVDKCNRFILEDEFFDKKRADLLVIATPDDCHVKHSLKAFEKGYDVLVEKPLTSKKEECEALLAAQKKYNNKVMVCHVLRYAPAFLKCKEFLDDGKIGRLVAINATEQVAYWHQAHSYVRGNWRNTKNSAPMILAKCCHDLDLLQYYAASPCESVSSVGDLTYFTKENAPEGSSERCVNCKHIDSCPYSAKRLYIDKWKEAEKPLDRWPYNVAAVPPLTEEKLIKAIETGPYGKCVFDCDNNVVDHQITQMTFKNGVKATLIMTAFTRLTGRRIIFHGTLGEIYLLEDEGVIKLKKFGENEQIINISQLDDNGYGHGGGDYFLIKELHGMLCGNIKQATSLKASIESHLMGICAEQSRLKGGELIRVHE